MRRIQTPDRKASPKRWCRRDPRIPERNISVLAKFKGLEPITTKPDKRCKCQTEANTPYQPAHLANRIVLRWSSHAKSLHHSSQDASTDLFQETATTNVGRPFQAVIKRRSQRPGKAVLHSSSLRDRLSAATVAGMIQHCSVHRMMIKGHATDAITQRPLKKQRCRFLRSQSVLLRRVVGHRG